MSPVLHIVETLNIVIKLSFVFSLFIWEQQRLKGELETERSTEPYPTKRRAEIRHARVLLTPTRYINISAI